VTGSGIGLCLDVDTCSVNVTQGIDDFLRQRQCHVICWEGLTWLL
jgi:hypothetical protein